MGVHVIARTCGFAKVAQAFASWTGGATEVGPRLGSDPIDAQWVSGDRIATYTANPVIGLAVIELAGELPDGIDTMAAAEARSLARSGDTVAAALGVTSIGLMGDVASLGLVDELEHDSRGPVSGAARLARSRLAGVLLRLGVARLKERAEATTSDEALLTSVRPGLRRQLVRHIIDDPPTDRDRLIAVVAAGLADDDPEVRWASVITAGRLRLPELIEAINACDIGSEWERDDRRVLEAIRDVVGGDFADRPLGGAGAGHLRACVLGAAHLHDRAWLLVEALTRPLGHVVQVREVDGFCHVGGSAHLVGDPGVPTNPLRSEVRPPYWIATAPGPTMPANEIERHLSTNWPDTDVRLPTVVELEMATRGPDGRRFPGGNTRLGPSRWVRSPWGLDAPLDRPEWAVADDGRRCTIGGRGSGIADSIEFDPALGVVRPVLVNAR